MRYVSTVFATMSLTVLLSSCATPPQAGYAVSKSRLAAGDTYQSELDETDNPVAPTESTTETSGIIRLPSSSRHANTSLQQDGAVRFSDTDQITVAAERMPAREFIHTIFGELLKTSYVVAEEISALEEPVTLNLAVPVSSRQLYLMAGKILDEKKISIALNEGVYFLHPKNEGTKSDVTIGVGRTRASVPTATGTILQMVPIRYGITNSLEITLMELTNLSVKPDSQKNVVFLKGDRTEILRALDLIGLLDVPDSRGKHVSILPLTYLSPAKFIDNILELMQSEGIKADKTRSSNPTLMMVPLEQIGAVALFGSDESSIERAAFWASQLDRPSEGAEKRYYIFHPRFARASDLGQSIAGLLGSALPNTPDRSRDTASAQSQSSDISGRARASSGERRAATTVSVQSEDVNMTVDDRSNTLIFFTTGVYYQNLLPMIRRLDVMPKQILLEATIAEVTLSDDFSMGVEFAFKDGRFGYSTLGGFGEAKIGGFGLSYINGANQVIAQIQATNNNVNVLSSPSIVVRDGVSANINVGSDLPTVGSTTINPGTETRSTTVEYRKTGVKLSVTPTINAQGLVIMEIDQSISNTTEGSTIPGSPAIFERSLQTEVLAQSGQTIMLGGLMSENKTKSAAKVPLLGDLPVLGSLFRRDKESTSKTELVILITPKVIDQPEHWQDIRRKLDSGLQHLKVND